MLRFPSRPPRLRARPCAQLALSLVAAASLAGCGLFSSSNEATAPAAACPTAAILRPLAQTAVFAPGAPRQPTGVAFYGVLSDVEAKCERVGGALRESLDVVVVGERGPAAAGGEAVDLQYFVAVVGPGQTILSKRTLPVHIAVPANQRRAGITDQIEETIPLAGGPVGSIQVVLGFQQSPDVVDFYKHFRGR